jgi:hypothetical protein
MLKITKEGLQEAGCLEEEAKVCFISLTPCFSSSVLPSSASGVVALSSFHQAVPGSFQVIVPVRKSEEGEQILVEYGI